VSGINVTVFKLKGYTIFAMQNKSMEDLRSKPHTKPHRHFVVSVAGFSGNHQAIMLMATAANFVSNVMDFKQRRFRFMVGHKRAHTRLANQIPLRNQVADRFIGGHAANAKVSCQLLFRWNLMLRTPFSSLNFRQQMLLDFQVKRELTAHGGLVSVLREELHFTHCIKKVIFVYTDIQSQPNNSNPETSNADTPLF
jgi:hypothetical protein